MRLRPLERFYFFHCGDREILTYKNGPRNERVNIPVLIYTINMLLVAKVCMMYFTTTYNQRNVESSTVATILFVLM